jgi:hypothetical protein
MTKPERSRRRRRPRQHASFAAVLARPAIAGAYPGYRPPESEHRTRAFLTGAALLHATVIAVLIALASLAPQIEDRVLYLQLIKPEEPAPPPPPPEPVLPPEPEPTPPPVKVEAPKPPPPKPPPPKPVVPKPEPPRPVVKPMPAPPPVIAPPAAPAMPARVARPAPARASAVRMPAPQIDATAKDFDLPAAPAIGTHREAPAVARATRTAPRSAAIDRVAPPTLASVPAAPDATPRAAPRRETARTARPEPIAQTPPSRTARNELRGVALSALLPCVTDARELELKQQTVAAARNRSLCESAAGRFHLVETKNVNAFLMRIEQAPGRRTGDRCEALALALDCLAQSPRSR